MNIELIIYVLYYMLNNIKKKKINRIGGYSEPEYRTSSFSSSRRPVTPPPETSVRVQCA